MVGVPQAFTHELGLKASDVLGWPGWAFKMNAVLSLTLACCVFALAWQWLGNAPKSTLDKFFRSLGFAGGTLLLAFGVLAIPTTRLRISFRGYTVGDLAKKVVAQNTPDLLKPSNTSWGGETLWDALSIILQDQIGVQEGKIVPEASFVDDLGLC